MGRSRKPATKKSSKRRQKTTKAATAETEVQPQAASETPPGLEEWHERFCWRYASTLNATRAYLAARDDAAIKPNTAATEAWKLLQRPEVKARVAEIQKQLRDECQVEAKDMLRHFMAIATADPNELVEFRRTCCRYCYGADFGYQRTQLEMDRDLATWNNEAEKAEQNGEPPPVAFDRRGGVGYDARKAPNPDCPACFGEGVGNVFVKDTRNLSPEAQALYAGVKETKDGFEIKMHDQQAAAVNAAKVIGAFLEKVELSGKVTLEDILDRSHTVAEGA